MQIMVLGLNHKTAPVAIREKFTFNENDLPNALQKLKKTKSILEVLILSTCNRMEIYAVVDEYCPGKDHTILFLANWFLVDKKEFLPYLYIKFGNEAINHLFRVTVGLDSLVIGETQILGQVRKAYLTAIEYEVTGNIFNSLFKNVITFGKKMHTETDIGKNPVSVSYAAVELAKKIFGNLHNKTVLLIGAGKMSELTAVHLYGLGVKKILVINRTFERAKDLAERFRGEAREWSNLVKTIGEADIVISSTGAEEIVVSKNLMLKVMKERNKKPIFIIDIAVPRDFAKEIEELTNVYLYNIDDLQGIVENNLAERQKIAEEIEKKITDEVSKFADWLSTLDVIPVINALRQKYLRIQKEVLESIKRKIPDLDEREMKILEKHTKSIINQVLKDPILQIKEIANKEHQQIKLEEIITIFGLEEEIEKLKLEK